MKMTIKTMFKCTTDDITNILIINNTINTPSILTPRQTIYDYSVLPIDVKNDPIYIAYNDILINLDEIDVDIDKDFPQIT